MNTDLAELYQELILDHGKNPRNQRTIDDANRTAEGFNPLCGDRVRVFVKLDDHQISDISFSGSGCAICTASASLMTQALRGKSDAEASTLFHAFHAMVTSGDTDDEVDVGKLAALAGVRRYPIRVKCATLPWHTLEAALADDGTVVSTE